MYIRGFKSLDKKIKGLKLFLDFYIELFINTFFLKVINLSSLSSLSPEILKGNKGCQFFLGKNKGVQIYMSKIGSENFWPFGEKKGRYLFKEHFHFKITRALTIRLVKITPS